MRDYGQIVTKLTSLPWAITSEGLDVILQIADARLNGLAITDDMKDSAARGREERKYRTYGAGVTQGVGILPIEGPIFGKANMMTELSGATSLQSFRKDLRSMMADDDVSSIVMEMDTPGGSVDFIRETSDEILAARDKKPIYAMCNSECGSAGLWLASQATQVFATTSGHVGSLGVYRVHVDQSKKDNDQGNRYTFIKAGKFKTEGNPHEPLSTEAIDFNQKQVNDTYTDFIAAVANGRNKTTTEVEENFGQGRMLTAKEALSVGMIDGIMEMEQLVSSLSKRSQPVQVELPDGSFAEAVLTLPSHLEVTGWEHSEPGTGSPPIERTNEDDKSGDRKGSGSRRNPPPILTEDEEATGLGLKNVATSSIIPLNQRTSSEHDKEDSLMSSLSAEALAALGLTAESATDEAVSTAITNLSRNASAEANQAARQKSFEELFPDQAAELARGRKNNATSFANDHKAITTGLGDSVKDSSVALSSLALESVSNVYDAILSGTSDEALEAFGKCLSVLNSDAGRVDYAEAGSSKSKAETPSDEPGDDDNDDEVEDGAESVREAANKMNKRARQLVNAAGGPSKMSYGDALAKAAIELPQAAKVYHNSLNSQR